MSTQVLPTPTKPAKRGLSRRLDKVSGLPERIMTPRRLLSLVAIYAAIVLSTTALTMGLMASFPSPDRAAVTPQAGQAVAAITASE